LHKRVVPIRFSSVGVKFGLSWRCKSNVSPIVLAELPGQSEQAHLVLDDLLLGRHV